MALITDFTFDLDYVLIDGGFSLPDVETSIKKQMTIEGVYVRVIDVSPITTPKETMLISEGEPFEGSTIYAELYDATRQNKLGVVSYGGFMPSNARGAVNIVQQAYEYLKTLDVFKDATDVFEEGQE